MRSRKGFTLIELLVVVAIIAILAAILFPVFMRAKAAAQASHCQSGMNQIGKAMKMYLSDWEDTFPTNRPFNPSTNPPTLLQIMASVRLSNPAIVGVGDEPIRFQYGIGWVEALYPYVEKVSEGDAASVWKCPAAKTNIGPSQSPYASSSYSFNYNLVEMPEGTIKNAGSMMMVRELDRKYDSVLRPTNLCITSASLPSDPFLDPTDKGTMKTLKHIMHGDGSNILFSDGHVKNFSLAYWMVSATLVNGQWDSQDQQWYNMVNIHTRDARRKAIAISP